MTEPAPSPTSRDHRDAKLAAHLAQGVREGAVEGVDALRVLRHELRRRNTTSKLRIVRRSAKAQEVIDKYSRLGQELPKNGSRDARRANHVHQINADTLARTITVAQRLTGARLDDAMVVRDQRLLLARVVAPEDEDRRLFALTELRDDRAGDMPSPPRRMGVAFPTSDGERSVEQEDTLLRPTRQVPVTSCRDSPGQPRAPRGCS